VGGIKVMQLSSNVPHTTDRKTWKQKKTSMSFLSAETHKLCLKSVPIVSVDVVILNHRRDKVLLFKRNNKPLAGAFYTLGGRTLKNESIADTAIRKLKEEASLVIAKGDLFLGGIMEEFFEDSIYKGVKTHNVNIFFGYIASKNLRIRIDRQHSQYQWIDITSEDIHPHVRYKVDLIRSINCFFYDPEINLAIPGK
jgi:ADP-ribose pyrophosphatase YjhB (NUDIX family)